YCPARDTLFYGDTAFGALPVFLPTFLLSGNAVLALNVLLLVAGTLTAAAVHLVAYRWTGSHAAAFVAGWTTLMTPWTLWEFNPTAPSEGMLQFLPFIVLLAAEPVPALWPLAALTVLQSFTDVAYIAAATVGPLLVLAAWRLLHRDTRRGGMRLLAVAAITAVALLPLHLQHLRVRWSNPGLATQTLWVYPSEPVRLPWGPFTDAPTAVPAVVFAVVALAIVLRRRAGAARVPGWSAAAFWSVVGLLMSLSPTGIWNGRVVVLPHKLLAVLTPYYDLLRVPVRLGVGGMIGLALLAGLAAEECRRRLPVRLRPLVPAALALAMFAQYAWDGTRLPGRYPLMEAATEPPEILAILRQPGGPVLEVPIGVKGDWDPSDQARAMLRSTQHWRWILNGYTSYWPKGFPERMALVEKLPDPAALAALRDETHLELIVVHLDDFQRRQRAACQKAVVTRGIDPGVCGRLGESDRDRWESAALAYPGLRLLTRTPNTLLFAVTP
ncbi:MAG TPA: hypothetical protein VLV15_02900, partial [Dongiaceae bacterium]|nr:hypothetical protein [Dongiaceae bacterium]